MPANEFSINGINISEKDNVFIIAEIGLNHSGDIKIAKKLIDHAIDSGASAAKLQSYKKGRVSSKVRTSRYYED